MKQETKKSEQYLRNMINIYKFAYGLIDDLDIEGTVIYDEKVIDNKANMEEFNWDDYDHPFIYTTLKTKKALIDKLFKERIKRNLEWDLEDELSKSKYKGITLTKEQVDKIKDKVRKTISSNIPLEEQLEIYESVWPKNIYRPILT